MHDHKTKSIFWMFASKVCSNINMLSYHSPLTLLVFYHHRQWIFYREFKGSFITIMYPREMNVGFNMIGFSIQKGGSNTSCYLFYFYFCVIFIIVCSILSKKYICVAPLCQQGYLEALVFVEVRESLWLCETFFWWCFL